VIPGCWDDGSTALVLSELDSLCNKLKKLSAAITGIIADIICIMLVKLAASILCHFYDTTALTIEETRAALGR
jgi:hypothetical protein